MSYLDRMVTASFRGVHFLTESHDQKSGRRLAVHEFIAAEAPEVEDLGAKVGEIKLNAYFIGADYDLARDKFLKVLNQPGAEWLWHPWRGQVWVHARDWSVQESNEKGGMCTVSVDFVDGGRAIIAMPVIDRADAADSAREEFRDALVTHFDLAPMSSAARTSMASVVQQQLEQIRKLISLARLPLTRIAQVRNVLDGVINDINELLKTPGEYAAALRSLSNALGLGDNLAARDRPRIVARLATLAALPVPVPEAGADYVVLRANLKAESALRGRMLVAAAAEVALADFLTDIDRDAVLASTVAAIDAALPSMSDPVFDPAVTMRTHLIEALLAQNLSPTQRRDIAREMPATALAHRMEVGETEFIDRNRVRHPLFVQGPVYG